MKAVIPLAGRGTRVRPHTLRTPKPLVHVAGRPVMSYILGELRDLGIDEIVFVVGYLQDVAREWIEREYPEFTSHFVVQEVQNGTAGAIGLAEPWADEDGAMTRIVEKPSKRSDLHDSIVGAHSHIRDVAGEVNAGPHTRMVGEIRRPGGR